ncbi:undecaprenyldiphospho-muramoylpentapeptide beta-N-acetylglucosaminyltransferase [Geobacter sulfurreducens]|jgi:UDP-N-acetylglucosamine--N-acetylmuramyl-(pentapeptide) pyrophosphoryl-undecaprenol N-acetylglucosamine transferase|uniref:undecaprenyldiphospho-muramoylpentapeptide beta-N-acetylglucosaminyltransferase n=1 Tax=Geobacter sulfurreducens TaxID=35554 RepID=UPI0001D8F1F3|nr:undecaprenyldiphospho-muramoylpentapeptide beta-N-acetylglucosaminyltransferase [Geobacter sulfurreducens]ADI85820.1 UDP-N-acetylglucosamine--N-acetylmuramyl-(pentapeptide)-pyrophosphoryl-undecaprenol N-acetylglucosamine transferase [Geobacter sulfurreducens KN400]QVW34867.1 undecaprenyldiphospho-muramoylpentapeptide beta-N-acetylglucosaminyltransferase [Geobacter sulfurreducens]UTG92386.1 undecaprenyldiphospho-muramoylpentapeptide beta-N-acetylglucosaminyltransferase [Geobacter sulfurreducen
MKLLIAGGGTGGHLFPGIAVAEEFLARDKQNEVLFVGTWKGIEARVLPKTGYRLECITAAGIRGKGSLARAKGLAKFLYGYAQSRKILKEFRPDLVLGVGGYASAPTLMAARGMQIPRFIHEQNAIPGFTNRMLAKVADKIFISLEESRTYFPEDKTLLTGNPLRRQILEQVALAESRERGDDAFHLLVFGGSAGAHRINLTMGEALPSLKEVKGRLRITHQTGENDLEDVTAAYEEQGFTADVVAFIDSMADAYRWADLIVCRAGATTLAEVTACGKPCIFIPYPHAVDDHQRRNAESLLKRGAGFVIIEQELSGEVLAQAIRDLMDDPARLKAVGEAAQELARLDAAQAIVDEMVASTRKEE